MRVLPPDSPSHDQLDEGGGADTGLSQARTQGFGRRRWLILSIGTVLVNLSCFISVAIDRANIRKVAFDVVRPGSEKKSIVDACMEFVHGEVNDNSDANIAALPFWPRMNYLWNPRRVGPATVFVYGNHHIAPCQSHSRATMALLEAHGITVRAIALHNSALRGSHGILEVDLGEEGTAVVDPQYGITYRRPDGRFATLRELHADPALGFSNQRSAKRRFIQGGHPIVEIDYPVDEDGYRMDFPAYCNFRDFGPFRFMVRDMLNTWFGDFGYLAVRWPNWYVLWPAYNLAAAVNILAFLCFLTGLVMRIRSRRRLSAQDTTGCRTAHNIRLSV